MPKKTHAETAEKLRRQKTAKIDQTNTARAALFARRALRFSTAVYKFTEVNPFAVDSDEGGASVVSHFGRGCL